MLDEVGRGLRHASRATARTESPALANERHRLLMPAGIALDARESVFEASAHGAMLKTTGRAAVVVPDNVLFEGGAGETIRRKLLQTTDLHTTLRLPTGIFYAQGVKANVTFFDNRPASPDPHSSKVWYYDYRTNVHHTLKQKPLTYAHLKDFIAYYKPENCHVREQTWSGETPDGRWRAYSRDELPLRDKASLDVFWLKDASMTDLENLPEPEVLADEIMENLRSALTSFEAVVGD